MGAASRLEILALYRSLLRAVRTFPSVKRGAIREDIRSEFREARGLEDSAAIAAQLEVARDGLFRMRQLSHAATSGTLDMSRGTHNQG
jgi:hypothetical protein